MKLLGITQLPEGTSWENKIHSTCRNLNVCRIHTLRLEKTDKAVNADSGKRLLRGFLAAVVVQLFFLPYAFAIDFTDTTSSGPSSPLPGDEPQQCELNPNGCQAGALDVGSSTGGLQPRNSVGNPIDLMSGNKFQSESDFYLPGSQLMFQRMYNSVATDSNLGLGVGWRHSFAVSLVDTGNGGREIEQSDGTRVRFDIEETNEAGFRVFRATQASRGYLIEQENGHEWHLSDGRVLSFFGSYLVKIDWPDQRSLKLYYQSQRLESVTDETGRTIQFTYTPWPINGLDNYSDNPLVSVPGHLEKITLPDGSNIEYDYDKKRNLSRVRFPDNTYRQYHYENETYSNHLTGLTNRLNTRFARWTYDEHGRANSSEHADGVEKVSLQYPDLAAIDNGEVVQTIVTNSLGEQSIYSWQRRASQEPPKLLSSIGPGCATCPATGVYYDYDERGRLIASVQTGSGNIRFAGDLYYEYDSLGRLIRTTQSVVEPDRGPIQKVLLEQSYKAYSAQPVLIKSPSVNASAQRSTETLYDDNNRPIQIIERGYRPVFSKVNHTGLFDTVEQVQFEEIERRTSLSWVDSRLTEIDGPRTDVNDTVQFEWDARNRLVGVVPPVSPALKILKFDQLGRAVQFQFGHRSPIELTYNLSGKVVQSRQGDNVLKYSYDAENQLTGLTDTDGHTKTIQHDAAGRIKSITDEVGRVSVLSLDTENRMISRTLLGIDGTAVRLMDYLFDEKGKLLRSSDQRMGGSSPSTQGLAFHSDSNDNSIQVTDAETGVGVSSVVDLLSRITTMTGIDGAQTQVGFDHQGGIVSVRDANGNLTLSPTDDFGRTVMKESADTGRLINRFDEAGNRLEQQLANGALVKYQYDAANRRILRDSNGEITKWLWSESDGQLVKASNKDTTELFEYDQEARLVGHIRKVDDHQFRTGFAYDSRGRLSSKTLPNGQRLSFHYHDTGVNKGKLRAIMREGLLSLLDNTIAADIDLERRDGRAGFLSGNGIRTTETIAPNGELSSLEISGSLAFDYSFDAIGRIVRIDRNDTLGEQHTTYTYNNGLISSSFNSAWGTQSWRYDKLGNRLSQETQRLDGPIKIDTYDYPPASEGSRLLRIDTTAVDNSFYSQNVLIDYAYSPAGSPLQVGQLRYTYNDWQRPISVSKDGVLIAKYVYNAFGERVKKTLFKDSTAPEVTYYLYDGSTLTAEANAAGEITRQYVYLEGHKPIAMLAGGETYAIHTDHIGAPSQMSNANGEMVWRADYLAFGHATLADSNSVLLNLRFPGQYFDNETGTHYNYFRDYDPDSGRYRTSDPMGLMAGLNTYAYANGLPQNLVDPLGLVAAVPVVAGGAFYTWLTTVSTVSGPPGWLVGGVVALGVAAYWYANHNEGGEQAFLEQTGNVKPVAADFYDLRFEIGRFDESLQPNFSDWDGTWGALFAAQNLLLEAQQNYIDRADIYMAANGGAGCLTASEQDKYDEAQAALALAAAATTTTTPPPPPDCDDLADKIRKQVYGNKHADNSYGPAGGTHGYLNRMLEQMCGANGPGTVSWRDHNSQLKQNISAIRNNKNSANQIDGCDIETKLSSFDKRMIELIKSPAQGWGADTLPYYGPAHAFCQGYKGLRDSGNIPNLLSQLGKMTGVPF